MLIVGSCCGIRSEQRLCEEVHLNLAYRWFCRLGLDGAVPDHSTFSKNRHGRFRESDLLRKVFETTVQRCVAEGLVGGEGFAVDASMTRADANRQRSAPGDEWQVPGAANRAVREYLAVLDEVASGAATSVVPKFISSQDCQEFRAEVGHDGSKGAQQCRDAKSPVYLTPSSTSCSLVLTQRPLLIRMAYLTI